MDGWSRGCLASVVFIFTPSLKNGISSKVRENFEQDSLEHAVECIAADETQLF